MKIARFGLIAILIANSSVSCPQSCVDTAQIAEAVKEFDGGEFHPALAKTREIEVPELGLKACLAEVAVRFPRLQLLFVDCDGQSRLLWVSKDLVPDWESVVRDCLSKGDFGTLLESDPTSVARGLTRILVDPDPKYGLLISSVNDIPAAYFSSDIYRDLKRKDLAEDEIHNLLLAKAPKDIGPPTLLQTTNGRDLVFYSWSYFGGQINRWTVHVGDEGLEIGFTVEATLVGSFDYYM